LFGLIKELNKNIFLTKIKGENYEDFLAKNDDHCGNGGRGINKGC
jgi:hypothetical protein